MKKESIYLAVLRITQAADKILLDSGATAWMLISTALVFLMVPVLAMLHGTLVDFTGYSMAFGSNNFVGW